MGSVFGKKSSKKNDSQVTEQDKAILQIKQQRDKIKQFQKKLTTRIEEETELIKKLVQTNQKQKALLLLKKKKYTEKILERTDNELLTIENMLMDIEYKNIEQSVLKGIEVGNQALKQLNAVFSIEQIENLLEETEDGIRKQQEINDLLSNVNVKEDNISDDNLDEELENLLEEHIELPNVPEDDLPQDSIKTKSKEKKVLVEA